MKIDITMASFHAAVDFGSFKPGFINVTGTVFGGGLLSLV